VCVRLLPVSQLIERGRGRGRGGCQGALGRWGYRRRRRAYLGRKYLRRWMGQMLHGAAAAMRRMMMIP
jgi:hypothetical protein